jgi:hypothetical protein
MEEVKFVKSENISIYIGVDETHQHVFSDKRNEFM